MSDTGSAKVESTKIGEIPIPPVAVLPDPSSLFLMRSKRLAALAPGHQLEPYLNFLATVTRAQHDIQADLPAVTMPPDELIARSMEHGMPPLSRSSFEPDEVAQLTATCLLERLAASELSAEAGGAVESLRTRAGDEVRGMLSSALNQPGAPQDIAQRSLLLAALQVHFTRMAAKLDAEKFRPSDSEGACPTCGSPPVASAVVNWPRANNTRFCVCSLCATMWYVVRVKCLLCGSTASVTFRQIDGERDTVKAETCDKCRGYVKILYQVKDPALEPLADDVATLGLDILLAGEGWRRGGENLFLLGY